MIATDATAVVAEIHRALDLLTVPAGVVEIRALKIPGRGKAHSAAGYFIDLHQAARAAAQADHVQKAGGVYQVLNGINPALLARSPNQLTDYLEPTTSDNDIIRRRWLPLDFDPQRPAGVSATEDEHCAAEDVARRCAAWLASQGWPAPIIADSGNGAHLLYRVDLPNDDASTALVRDMLAAIAAKCDSEVVRVDLTVFNAARIWKLYGTTARKGHSMPDRPHRVARLVEVPDSVEVVPVGKLEALAATAAKPEPASQNGNGHGVAPFTNRLDVPRWLADHGVAFRTKERPDSKGRTIYVLDQCPFDSGHGGSGETSIMQGTDGKLAAACMHNSCAGRGWQQFKEAIGAPDPGHYSPPLTKAKDRKRRAKKPITLQSIENASDVPSLCFPEGRTEVANAARLAKMHGDKLRWCHPWNKPLVWDGRRWVIDQQRRCDALAKAVYQSLWQEMASVVGSQDDAPDDDSLIQQMLSFIRQTGTARGIEAMLRLVRSEAGIPITPESLDAHPWLLNCENGTLDLRTGKLLAHRREDCLTKLCQAVYDRDAKCPRWLAFQDRICGGNQSLVDFKQRFYGVCLTGDVSEQILAIYHGTGANGKSTEIETIMGILGADYAIKAASDLLMVKNAETHPTERADLFGKRFVAVVETEHERRLAESLVKELTGGDRIRARRMREDFWEFTPTHKLVIATNHKPVVRGTDHAIWRRLRLVPFSVTIPKPEQDRQLLEKLRTEYPGILAWCVRGCLAWQRDGLGEPAVVTAATSLYRQSQDMLARFIEECCIVASSARVRASDLLAAYRKWSGNDHASQRWLGEALTERSFDTAVIGGYTWRIGIGLKNEDA